MDANTKLLAQHVETLYTSIKSLHTVLATTLVISKAINKSFASVPGLQEEYQKRLTEPLTTEELKSVHMPLQSLERQLARLRQQFGPFGDLTGDVN
jgi:cell shape-determining protein MreC